MNGMLSTDTDVGWEHIAPYLDEAMGELSEPERDALLLRYFKNHDFCAVGATLGISGDAAQKRVSRAVERLREYFSKRKITVGVGGLIALISGNAVQSAPVGLAMTISAAAIAGTAATTSTVIAATTKTIAMTTLQKTLVATTAAVLAGAGIYQAKQAHDARVEAQRLQQQQTPLVEQIQQLQSDFADATNRLAGLLAENSRLITNPNEAELLKLRGEVSLLRRDTQELPGLKAKVRQFEDKQAGQMKNFREQEEQEALTLLRRMKEEIELVPGQEQTLHDLLLKRADLVVRDVQALSDGNEMEFSKEFIQSMSNVTAQIDAVFLPEQQADYKAFQQSGQAVGARLRAAGDLIVMQRLVGIGPEQQEQIYSILYSFALKQREDTVPDDTEKANALSAVLTPAQMEQYRKFMQGKPVTTMIQYPKE